VHLTRRATLGLLILLALAGLAAAARTTIVFDGATLAAREVFAAGPSGKRVRNRTRKVFEDANLISASPSGKRVVWLTIEDPAGSRGHLHVARSRRGRARMATKDLVGRPLAVAWSPDSKLLLFEHRDPATDRSDVYRVTARGRRRRVLTGDLAGSASVPGPGTEIRVSPDGDRAAVLWAFPERRGVLLLDTAGASPPERVTEARPDGSAGSAAVFLSDGTLVFEWFDPGAAVPDLYRYDGATLALEAAGVRSFAVAGDHLAVHADALTISGPTGRRVFDPEDVLLSFRLAPDGSAAAIAGARVFRVPVSGEAEEVLASRTLESVEEVVLVPGGEGLVVRAREAGERRLFFTGPGDEVREPAAGLAGVLGAAVSVSPAGDLVLFRMIDPDTSEGALFAWSPLDGTRRDLTMEGGVPGTPVGATFSPRRGDLLFGTVAGSDLTSRLFLWRRKKDRVVPLSPPGLTVGRFLFTR
jgi:hypothetical protein